MQKTVDWFGRRANRSLSNRSPVLASLPRGLAKGIPEHTTNCQERFDQIDKVTFMLDNLYEAPIMRA